MSFKYSPRLTVYDLVATFCEVAAFVSVARAVCCDVRGLFFGSFKVNR